ncbi:MAG: hypothetical protein IKM82_05755 [Oscillospiraceae bacterium]|nr:hypothetical protein [Oscillospiraceae bacterium]
MALTDESSGNGFYMPVQPAGYGYGNQGGGFGWGGDWAWILLLLLIGGGGWGMGGFGMGGMMWPMMMGGFGGGFGLDYLYPWLNNSQHISDGFRDQQLQTSIGTLQNSVTAGFGDVQLDIAGINQNLCQTGNAITGAVRDGFYGAEISANGRQTATMQQLFGIQSAQQQCCCENRAAIADTKYTISTEACATRQANSDNTQKILDKLCQLEIDGVRRELAAEQRENANLRSDLMYARGQASQVAQTAEIRASQAVTANQLVSELRSCPIPAQPVYGNQPIFTCPQTVNTGCGCGGFGFNAA